MQRQPTSINTVSSPVVKQIHQPVSKLVQEVSNNK